MLLLLLPRYSELPPRFIVTTKACAWLAVPLCPGLSPQAQSGVGLAPVCLSFYCSNLSMCPPSSILSCISLPLQHHFLCTDSCSDYFSLVLQSLPQGLCKESSRRGSEPQEKRKKGLRMSLSQFQKRNKLRDIKFQREHSPFHSPTLSFLQRL